MKVLGLNRAGFVATEVVQAIQPVATIPTRHGVLLCKGGHGRLLWRARTFHSEEPETVAWLDTLEQEDILWDVGANVGLYSIYAAKFRGCKVIAFEPESQNYALLVENIALNRVEDRCFPACFAITDHFGLGHLRVRYVTKGGAYHMFEATDPLSAHGHSLVPKSVEAVRGSDEKGVVEQLVFGVSLDDLALKHGLAPPTHLKVDVDGLEPWIIDGASRLVEMETLRSILIEINKNSARDMLISEVLAGHGFRLVSERSNWLSRSDRTKEHEIPTTNLILSRA